MSDMPERIWADEDGKGWFTGHQVKPSGFTGFTGYIRADLHSAERERALKHDVDRHLAAANAAEAEVERLRETVVPHIADLRKTADTIEGWGVNLGRTVLEIRKAADELEEALAATAQPEQDGGLRDE